MLVASSPDSPLTFNVSFRQAEDYPVDLYFLLDLSYTMVREKGAQKRLIALGLEMRKLEILVHFPVLILLSVAYSISTRI